jgi:DNA-binding IclR family transcriptional regulator
MRSITNVTNFIQSSTPGQGDDRALDDPRVRVLAAIDKVKRLPLADLTSTTGLSPSDCLQIVENLRSLDLVEVVEVEDIKQRLLRLTPAGSAYLLQRATR